MGFWGVLDAVDVEEGAVNPDINAKEETTIGYTCCESQSRSWDILFKNTERRDWKSTFYQGTRVDKKLHSSRYNRSLCKAKEGPYCIAGHFRQELIFVTFVKAIFWLSLIPDYFFFTTTSVGSEIFMNLKMNDDQKSFNRTIEEQTSDHQCLTKISSWPTAWRSLLTKIFCYTVA